MPDQQLARQDLPPRLATRASSEGLQVQVLGSWKVLDLAQPGILAPLQAELRNMSRRGGQTPLWDLRQLVGLDHLGAQVLWDAWQQRLPEQVQMLPAQSELFQRLAASKDLQLPGRSARGLSLRNWLRQGGLLIEHGRDLLLMLGQLLLDLLRFASQPHRGPWKELSAQVFHVGYQALGITALVGFLIGVVLSFLSAQQLRALGGDVYLVNILGMSVIRELGPMLAAILVAGRSGSSITAQLGVMRVTEELDAMTVMNLPHGFTLIMPRILALALAMPLLVVWTDAMALLGGMCAAWVELGLTFTHFVNGLPNAVPLPNYFLGLGKGVTFGVLIGLVACHFGLRIEPDTNSLGRGTTASVVTAITVVILADAVFAILFKSVGFKGMGL